MKVQTLFAAALGSAAVLAGAATLWLRAGPGQSAIEPASTLSQGPDLSRLGTNLHSEALSAEIDRLNAEKEALKRRSGELKGELDSLRSGLTQVNRNQAAIGQEVRKLSDALPGDGTERPAPPRPEQEREKAEARIQAQVETLETSMRGEKADLSAQASLQQGFQHAEVAGLQLANAQCGATLCRVELTSDGSASSADTFRSVSHIAPWPGQRFATIDSGSGKITVYVAREGYALPQARN